MWMLQYVYLNISLESFDTFTSIAVNDNTFQDLSSSLAKSLDPSERPSSGAPATREYAASCSWRS